MGHRNLFRQHYRQHAEEVARHVYDPGLIGCMLLITSHETTLEGLIERPLAEGDLLSNANTVLYMGKIPRRHQVPPRDLRRQASRQRLSG